MRQSPTQVVICGAGPTGLLLAYELALAGIRPLVLERLLEPTTEPRANGLTGQAIRLLKIRGLYRQIATTTRRAEPARGAAFAAIPISAAGLANDPLPQLVLPQRELVQILAHRVRCLGGDIRWGHRLVEFASRPDDIFIAVASPDGNYDLRATFLVGADGGHSHIRKRLGIGFPGVTTNTVTRMAHVSLPDRLRVDGGIEIPGRGRLSYGHHRLEAGVFIVGELQPGRIVIATVEYGAGAPDKPLTLQEMRDSAHRVLGADLPIRRPCGSGPHPLRRIDSQNTRQAERYRVGNVVLVGDAAHVYAGMGIPSLNIGLADAMNVGWKLAAHLNDTAPAGLLDTYHTERHRAGQRVITQSLATTALLAPGPEVTALRTLIGELLQQPDAAAHIVRLIAGSDIVYDVGDNHPLAGRFIPDLPLTNGQRIAELLHDGKPLLLDLAGGAVTEAARGWNSRINTVSESIGDAPATALLIRPDGYIAWGTDNFTTSDKHRLRGSLQRWIGAPREDDPASK
jgi:2-polyprenyl-6-methoxyphenol hydroxylase-like FAD-dependent oxidoreductase